MDPHRLLAAVKRRWPQEHGPEVVKQQVASILLEDADAADHGFQLGLPSLGLKLRARLGKDWREQHGLTPNITMRKLLEGEGCFVFVTMPNSNTSVAVKLDVAAMLQGASARSNPAPHSPAAALSASNSSRPNILQALTMSSAAAGSPRARPAGASAKVKVVPRPLAVQVAAADGNMPKALAFNISVSAAEAGELLQSAWERFYRGQRFPFDSLPELLAGQPQQPGRELLRHVQNKGGARVLLLTAPFKKQFIRAAAASAGSSSTAAERVGAGTPPSPHSSAAAAAASGPASTKAAAAAKRGASKSAAAGGAVASVPKQQLLPFIQKWQFDRNVDFCHMKRALATKLVNGAADAVGLVPLDLSRMQVHVAQAGDVFHQVWCNRHPNEAKAYKKMGDVLAGDAFFSMRDGPKHSNQLVQLDIISLAAAAEAEAAGTGSTAAGSSAGTRGDLLGFAGIITWHEANEGLGLLRQQLACAMIEAAHPGLAEAAAAARPVLVETEEARYVMNPYNATSVMLTCWEQHHPGTPKPYSTLPEAFQGCSQQQLQQSAALLTLLSILLEDGRVVKLVDDAVQVSSVVSRHFGIACQGLLDVAALQEMLAPAGLLEEDPSVGEGLTQGLRDTISRVKRASWKLLSSNKTSRALATRSTPQQQQQQQPAAELVVAAGAALLQAGWGHAVTRQKSRCSSTAVWHYCRCCKLPGAYSGRVEG
ncbi:hypothetical protein OEZ86_001050 [Tetradesmus obliquus]|nr:hypothetical protein OEZ86_001050 [Tetradesmus obliquus]